MGGVEKQERFRLGGNRVRMNNSKITIQRCRLHYGDQAVGDREAAL